MYSAFLVIIPNKVWWLIDSKIGMNLQQGSYVVASFTVLVHRGFISVYLNVLFPINELLFHNNCIYLLIVHLLVYWDILLAISLLNFNFIFTLHFAMFFLILVLMVATFLYDNYKVESAFNSFMTEAVII